MTRYSVERIVPRLGFTLLVAALFIGCHHNQQSPPSGEIQRWERSSLDLLNRERQRHGLPSVDRLDRLDRVARRHSESMRDLGFFDHRDLRGLELADRLEAEAMTYSWAAENLSWMTHTSDPAQDSLRQFLESPTHRSHLLHPSSQKVGIGLAQKGHTFWMTHIYLEETHD